MLNLPKGAKVSFTSDVVELDIRSSNLGAVDFFVLQTAKDRARNDEDLVFYASDPKPGVKLRGEHGVDLNLGLVDPQIDRLRVLIGTEGQHEQAIKENKPLPRLVDVTDLSIEVRGGITDQDGRAHESVTFDPPTNGDYAMIIGEVYRHKGGWKFSASGDTLKKLDDLTKLHGIEVDDPSADQAPTPAAPAPAPAPTPAPSVEQLAPVVAEPKPSKIVFEKKVISKHDTNRKIDIDLTKGEPDWLVEVEVIWAGRHGGEIDEHGNVLRVGDGDLDVYAYVRNEKTNEYEVIGGERDHRGSLDSGSRTRHSGDSSPDRSAQRPGHEMIQIKPTEDRQIAINLYQSLDNGGNPINSFNAFVEIRYGKPGKDGKLNRDQCDIHTLVPGDGQETYWATLAMIDMQKGKLIVDATDRYGVGEHCPGITTAGKWIAAPKGGPMGQQKSRSHDGQTGLTRFSGKCQDKSLQPAFEPLQGF